MRAKLGLSAADLAKLIGVSQQSVYNWEYEKSTPRQNHVGVIAALKSLGKKEVRRQLATAAVASRMRRRAKA